MRTRAISSLLVWLLAAAVALVMFFPIGWMILTGTKSETDAIAIPPNLAWVPSLDKFAAAFTDGDYVNFLGNSVTIVAGSVLAALALGLPAAYGLAFFPGRRAKDVLFFALSTRFMPGVAVIVPLFLLYSKIGLIDSRIGLVLVDAAMNIPLVLWLMRRFFREIPFEIIEAAMIECRSHVRIFWRVVLPLSIPGLGATIFLLVILTWNEFFFAVNLTGQSAATLPVYMASFMTTEGQTWAQMSAAATLATLPIMILGWLVARSLVLGLTSGAVK
jgi:sorbitol/mannitol transport system permease protein